MYEDFTTKTGTGGGHLYAVAAPRSRTHRTCRAFEMQLPHSVAIQLWFHSSWNTIIQNSPSLVRTTPELGSPMISRRCTSPKETGTNPVREVSTCFDTHISNCHVAIEPRTSNTRETLLQVSLFTKRSAHRRQWTQCGLSGASGRDCEPKQHHWS